MYDKEIQMLITLIGLGDFCSTYSESVFCPFLSRQGCYKYDTFYTYISPCQPTGKIASKSRNLSISTLFSQGGLYWPVFRFLHEM